MISTVPPSPRAFDPRANSASLEIEVSFDLICPWCLIGKRHLESALDLLRVRHPEVLTNITWRSHPLLPEIPKQGLPYAEFYVQRLGTAQAVASRQQQVLEAGRAAGVEMAFDQMKVFPNSLDAHHLVAQAQSQGGSYLAGAVIDALFNHYFIQGRDIGAAEVLDELFAEFAISRHGGRIEPAVPSPRDLHGVPYFVFNDAVTVEGAQRPAWLLEAMLHALSLSGRDSVTS